MIFVIYPPPPQFDYTRYIPRSEKLNLKKYKNKLSVIEQRYIKIEKYIQKSNNLFEIGASNGSFLEYVKNKNTILTAGIDPDQSTLESRRLYCVIDLLDLEDAIQKGNRFDIICLFHVFEHFQSPGSFLGKIKKIMNSESFLIIEVPSLFDPLLSVYDNLSYRQFYFQAQHPFVYSHNSLARVMEFHKFETIELISHQRYGLENHLQWLSNGKPGGNSEYYELTNTFEEGYLKKLEETGKTDTVIWVGRIKADA